MTLRFSGGDQATDRVVRDSPAGTTAMDSNLSPRIARSAMRVATMAASTPLGDGGSRTSFDPC